MTDSTLVPISKSFESVLVNKGILSNEIVDGWVKYGTIKGIDTLKIPAISAEHEQFKSIRGIEFFTNLRYLDISGSYIDSLDLSKNLLIEYVSCKGQISLGGTIATIRYLNVSKCRGLKFLDCYSNRLRSLDLSQNPNLIHLFCGMNLLNELNISQNRQLKVLETTGNEQISALYLHNCRDLEQLYCSYNTIVALDLSNLAKLDRLDCSFNWQDGKKTFETLDLSKNVMLTYLNVGGTLLRTLDLKANNELQTLDVNSMNNLEALDVSHLKKLAALELEGSMIKSLDVSKNSNLEGLGISRTALRAIDLTKNINLKILTCRSQQFLTNLDLRQCKAIDVCVTVDCPSLKTICVNVLPDLSDPKWKTNSWTTYSLCK